MPQTTLTLAKNLLMKEGGKRMCELFEMRSNAKDRAARRLPVFGEYSEKALADDGHGGWLNWRPRRWARKKGPHFKTDSIKNTNKSLPFQYKED